MSKTLEEQFREVLIEHAPKWNAYPIKALTKVAQSYANQQTREALERVLENASGGGSWRRVIHKELSTLTEDTNQEE